MNQRDAALRLANARRSHWARERKRIEGLPKDAGRRAVAEIIDLPDDHMGAIKVGRLLRFPRGAGDVLVTRLLKRSGIHPEKLVRDLTLRQRGILAAAVVDGYRMPLAVDFYGRVPA